MKRIEADLLFSRTTHSLTHSLNFTPLFRGSRGGAKVRISKLVDIPGGTPIFILTCFCCLFVVFFFLLASLMYVLILFIPLPVSPLLVASITTALVGRQQN